jgi:hypothetical protein
MVAAARGNGNGSRKSEFALWTKDFLSVPAGRMGS